MTTYDYIKGKKRVEEILDNELKIIEQMNYLMMNHLLFQMVNTVGCREFF